MRTLLALVTAGLIVAIGVWLNVASHPVSVSEARMAPSISIWEIHNRAHLENLPVERFEDQSPEFAEARR